MATTDASYEKEGCLHEMFIRQAKKTPSKTAVVDPVLGKLGFHCCLCTVVHNNQESGRKY